MHSTTSQRILCVSNICVNTIGRHLVMELNTRVVSLLSEWISLLIVSEEDYICESCNEILMRTLNQQLAIGSDNAQSSGSTQQCSHLIVCILCGLSLLSRQSHLILNNNQSKLQRQISTVLEARIPPHQVASSDRICHPCWLSCKQAALHVQQVDEAREIVQGHNEDPGLVEHVVEEQPEVESGSIVLTNYRRAAAYAM